MAGTRVNAWARPPPLASTLPPSATAQAHNKSAWKSTSHNNPNADRVSAVTPSVPVSGEKDSVVDVDSAQPKSPPVNPWKPLQAEGSKTTTTEARQWPALEESLNNNKISSSSRPSSRTKSLAKSNDIAPTRSATRKEKWVPYTGELLLQSRRRGDHDSYRDGDRRKHNRRNARSHKKGPSSAVKHYDEHAAEIAQHGDDSALAAAFGMPLYPQYYANDSAVYYPSAPVLSNIAHDSLAAGPLPGSAFNANVPEVTLSAIQLQVEYYLSEENLARDSYLRAQMDDQGWVPIEHLATFNRLAMLSQSVPEIAASLAASIDLEVKNGVLVRRRVGWEKFVPQMQSTGATLFSLDNSSIGPTPAMATFNIGATVFVPGR